MEVNENPDCKFFSIMDYQRRTELNPCGSPAISSLSTKARIEDHKSEVLSCAFHPTGQFFLSSNKDGEIHVCDIDNESGHMVLMKGHTGAVTEAHFSNDGLNIHSSSADKTIGIWDPFVGSRIGLLEGHMSDVNCVQGAKIPYPVLCSGSKDGTLRIWDVRENDCAMSLDSGIEINAACFNENGEYAFSSGLDKDITIWDLRMCSVVTSLHGHTDTVTGVSLSPCGAYILSNSVDNTLRIWDIRPYASSDRLVGCFPSKQNIEDGLVRCSWSTDSKMISTGTSDQAVSVWDPLSGVKLFQLPVHEGSINDVAFHPNELIMLTASKNKYLCLHELCN